MEVQLVRVVVDFFLNLHPKWFQFVVGKPALCFAQKINKCHFRYV